MCFGSPISCAKGVVVALESALDLSDIDMLEPKCCCPPNKGDISEDTMCKGFCKNGSELVRFSISRNEPPESDLIRDMPSRGKRDKPGPGNDAPDSVFLGEERTLVVAEGRDEIDAAASSSSSDKDPVDDSEALANHHPKVYKRQQSNLFSNKHKLSIVVDRSLARAFSRLPTSATTTTTTTSTLPTTTMTDAQRPRRKTSSPAHRSCHPSPPRKHCDWMEVEIIQ